MPRSFLCERLMRVAGCVWCYAHAESARARPALACRTSPKHACEEAGVAPESSHDLRIAGKGRSGLSLSSRGGFERGRQEGFAMCRVGEPVAPAFAVENIARVAANQETVLRQAVRAIALLGRVHGRVSGRLLQKLLALGVRSAQKESVLEEHAVARIAGLGIPAVNLRHRAVAGIDRDVSLGITTKQIEGERIRKPVQPALVGEGVLSLAGHQTLVRDQTHHAVAR